MTDEEWVKKAEELMKRFGVKDDDPLSPEEQAANRAAWAKIRGTGKILAGITHDGFLVWRMDIRPRGGGVIDGYDRVPITEPSAQEEMKRFKLSKPGDSTVMILKLENDQWVDDRVLTEEEYDEYLKNR